MKDRYFIESVRRGLQVLEAFNKETPSLTLTEIADSVGLDKSTVFRFAYTLEKLGYLRRDPETRRYYPGLKILRLGFTVLDNLGFSKIAKPFLRSLSLQCGETTNMVVREGNEIVYIARNRTQQIVNVNLQVGSRLPVYCTSMGKVVLVDMTRDDLIELLGEGPYSSLTPNTIVYPDDLMAELDKVRERGYAINDEELAIGLRSVAAPIRGVNGEIVAAINISVPCVRVTKAAMESDLAPMVMDAARQISNALGGES
ncbi:MAG: IclR family transcriptional regulator [Anaerolineales bacterium]|nr:IclR family transcriptional regulator [Anaerolineales bacterium]